jgi:hypothetical protein
MFGAHGFWETSLVVVINLMAVAVIVLAVDAVRARLTRRYPKASVP